jgi:methionyl-tRNA formyltransferase
LKLAWIGSHFEGLEAFTALLEAGVPFCAAVTLDETTAAKRSGAVDYRAVCDQYDVRLIHTSDINAADTVDCLRSLQIDLGMVIGWSQILRPDTLATSRFGWIGTHASMLPKNRGSAPVNWALIRGETETGNSLIWLSERVDEGNLIAQRPVEITPYDTCATIYQRIGETNRDMLLEVLPQLLAGERISHPQPSTSEELLPRRRPRDGVIDWCRSGREIYDFVRALTMPYPGAFGFLDGKQYTIWEAALLPIDSTPESTPGDVVGSMISPAEQSCGQLVTCGQGVLAILDIEDENGTRLRGPDLAALDWRGKRWRHVA